MGFILKFVFSYDVLLFYCPVKLYDKLRFFYRTANILLEDTMA